MAASGGREQDTPILSPRKSSPRRRRNNTYIYTHIMVYMYGQTGKTTVTRKLAKHVC